MKAKMMHNLWKPFYLILTFSVELWSSTGGAIGETFSGSSNRVLAAGGGTEDSFFIVSLILRIGSEFFSLFGIPPLIGWFILVLAIAFFAYKTRNKWIQKSNSIIRNLPSETKIDQTDGFVSFQKKHPEFDLEAFKSKVEKAFYTIQESWSHKNLCPSRRFISDGVYQRFHMRIDMLRRLQQENILSDVSIRSIHVHNYKIDGPFSIITVAIAASLKDEFICEKNSSLNKSSLESFTEYWSFIKQGNDDINDIYNSTLCPQCSKPLPDDMGEIAKCSACGSLINTGAFDWILAEITQSQSLAIIKKINQKTKVKFDLARLYQAIPDFCLQQLEDKVSNAYIQIQGARALQQPARIRRFMEDNVFTQIEEEFLPKGHYWNRLHINHMSVVRVQQFENQVEVSFLCEAVKQEVSIKNNQLQLIDAYPKTELRVISMKRSVMVNNKGNIYAHQCPNCGSPIADSLSIDCPYCFSPLNSVTHDWVVTQWIPWTDFSNQIMNSDANSSRAGKHLTKTQAFLDKSYPVKDCVLNNLYLIAYADGEVSPEEKLLLDLSAKRLGLPIGVHESMHSLAQSHKLSLRWPQSRKDKLHILTLMKKLAWSDGRLDVREKELLKIAEEQINTKIG
jgi:hypothetical protein